MKKFLALILSLICITGSLGLFACADNKANNNAEDRTQTAEGDSALSPENKPTEGEDAEQSPITKPTEEDKTEENIMYIKIGNTTLAATLEDNTATAALKDKLKIAPITIDMTDYGGWEKVGGLGFELPTSNEQITAQPCEFVLYQGNQLVIFYGSNSWDYTRLGKFENVTQVELKEILGIGDVTVTLTLEK